MTWAAPTETQSRGKPLFGIAGTATPSCSRSFPQFGWVQIVTDKLCWTSLTKRLSRSPGKMSVPSFFFFYYFFFLQPFHSRLNVRFVRETTLRNLFTFIKEMHCVLTGRTVKGNNKCPRRSIGCLKLPDTPATNQMAASPLLPSPPGRRVIIGFCVFTV